MAAKRMVITSENGHQKYESDFSLVESIALLEIWKHKLIDIEVRRQGIKEDDLQQPTTDKGTK